MSLYSHSGLFIISPDNQLQGKDEVFLCSLSNFDAYTVTRAYKAPKPFVFAVKSTDNLTFFENKADYLHMFSCQARDGLKWVEKILVARVSPTSVASESLIDGIITVVRIASGTTCPV